jgi:hypothetical protein
MKALAVPAAFSAVLISHLLLGDTAHADHTTRQLILEDNGLDYRLVALTMLMVVVALFALVFMVRRWEREDEQDEGEAGGDSV